MDEPTDKLDYLTQYAIDHPNKRNKAGQTWPEEIAEAIKQANSGVRRVTEWV